MIGAGIFVFPGLAAGRAGPAATRSFAIGAVVALLIALPTAELATAITATVAALVWPTDASITLLYATSDDEDDESGRRVLSGMTTTLDEAGIPERRVTRRVEHADDVEAVLLGASPEHDLVILGEDDTGVLEWMFGATSDRVAERTLSPVLVVRRPLEE